MRAERVGDGTASSLGPSLSFCTNAAVAVVAVFSASYYGVQPHYSFLLLCPWHCCLLLHYQHPGNRSCQAGMAH